MAILPAAEINKLTGFCAANPLTHFISLGILVQEGGSIEQRVPCPQCAYGPRDNTLGVNIDTGTYHCFRCGFKGRASGRDAAVAAKTRRISDPAIAERKRERLRTLWRESVPLTEKRAWAVRRYLESRALGPILAAPPASLRAHSAVEYWEGTRSIGQFPAMVALFVNRIGVPITLHVTYLRADGCAKAAVRAPKKLLGVPVAGATRGGAIRLHEPQAGIVGIAEGIESALSLHLLREIPVWASFCADNLALAQLPRDLRALHIGVDIDPSGKGEEVAQILATRVSQWHGSPKVFLVLPEGHAPRDLNDELRQRSAI